MVLGRKTAAFSAFILVAVGVSIGWFADQTRIGLKNNANLQTTCRPSDPVKATDNKHNVVLYLGNSLVFDHDWQIDGTAPVNCAQQGRTAAELVIDGLPDILPRTVVVGFGTVEYLRAEKQNRQPDIEYVAKSIEAVSVALNTRYPEAKILLLGLPPLEVSGKRIDTAPLNASIADLTERNGLIWAPISTTSRYDGIHLNESEYAQWERAITLSLESPD